MKKYTADYIFDGYKMLKNAVLITDDHHRVIDILPSKDTSDDICAFTGIITPGFINAHCHLELSHLKNQIPPHTGLPRFIRKIPAIRNFEPREIRQAIENAHAEMKQNGIVAVGDICNTSDSFFLKKQSDLYYLSFIEVYGFAPKKASTALDNAVALLKKAEDLHLPAYIVPHAPYSVSLKLFDLLHRYYQKYPGIVSIHNQECASENEMFLNGSGEMLQIMEDFGNDISHWTSFHQSSLETVLKFIAPNQKILFVHNTFTSPETIKKLAHPEKYFWCLCPEANLYIENRLPDIPAFFQHSDNVCLGTDSLASNHQLSILQELKTILRHFPEIPVEKLLSAATINGAKALGIDDTFGSFEKNKTPGINLLKNTHQPISFWEVSPLV